MLLDFKILIDSEGSVKVLLDGDEIYGETDPDCACRAIALQVQVDAPSAIEADVVVPPGSSKATVTYD